MSRSSNFTKPSSTATSSRHIGVNEILNPVQSDNPSPYSSSSQNPVFHTISPPQSCLPVNFSSATASSHRQLPRSASTDTVSSLRKAELSRSHTESSIRQSSNFSLSITTPPPTKPQSLKVPPLSAGVIQDRSSARLSPSRSTYESAHLSQNDPRVRHASPTGLPMASSPMQTRPSAHFPPRPPMLSASNAPNSQPSSPASDQQSNASPDPHHQMPPMSGPATLIPYTIDWDSGSSKAAEKRRKSSFASKKFRQRKKARQWEQVQMARQQSMENRLLKDERDCFRAESEFYRNERDFLRSWIESLGVNIPGRPQSPKWRQREAEMGQRRNDAAMALTVTSPSSSSTAAAAGGAGGTEVYLDSDEDQVAHPLAMDTLSTASRPRIGSLPARLGYPRYSTSSNQFVSPPHQPEMTGAVGGNETEPGLTGFSQIPSLNMSRSHPRGTFQSQQ